MESFISPQRRNTDTISKWQDCSQNKVHIDFHTLYSRLFSTSQSLNRLCVRNTCFDMCSMQEENQDSCIKMFWLLDRKLSSNLHPVMSKKHLPFVSVLKSELNKHTHWTIYRPKWFLEQLFLLEYCCLVSLRVSEIMSSDYFQLVLCNHCSSPIWKCTYCSLVGGLLRTLLEKVQLPPVLFIAKSILLCISPDPHKTTTIEESSYRFG